MSQLQELPYGTKRHSLMLKSHCYFIHLVVRGASTVEVAINGIHLKGISGPLSLHGGLHIIVTVEGDSALLVVTAQASYDHRILVLHWSADLDLSSCSTALPFSPIIDRKPSRQSSQGSQVKSSVQLQLSSVLSTAMARFLQWRLYKEHASQGV